MFCYYFTRLKSREISCKIGETRKIFPVLHSKQLRIIEYRLYNSWAKNYNNYNDGKACRIKRKYFIVRRIDASIWFSKKSPNYV